MPAITAVYDSCVLYPAPLRDLLMHLAVVDLVRARWTDEIHDEWILNVLEDRPDLTREQLERTRALMNAHAEDSLVRGYEGLISKLTLPDPDDRHVLAAAIHAQADVIVTYNLADFPRSALSVYGIEAQHPDDFVIDLLNLSEEAVSLAVMRQRANLRRPSVSAEELLWTFERLNLKNTAARLRELISEI